MARFENTLNKISGSFAQSEVMNNGARKIKVTMEELSPNKLNNYELVDIEELAFLIAEVGLLQQFVVMDNEDKSGYIILAGHRRYEAIKYNIEQGITEQDEKFDAICFPYTADEKEQNGLIHIANFYRNLSEKNLYERAVSLIEYFESVKPKGRFEGGYRNFLAKQLNTNPSAIQSIQTIRKKAIPEVVEKVMKGDYSIGKANDIAKKSAEEQKQIIEELKKEGNERKRRARKKKDEKETLLTENKSDDVIGNNQNLSDTQNSEKISVEEIKSIVNADTDTDTKLSRSEIRTVLNYLLDELPISDEEGRNIVNGIRMRVDGVFAMDENHIRRKYLDFDIDEDVIEVTSYEE